MSALLLVCGAWWDVVSSRGISLVLVRGFIDGY